MTRRPGKTTERDGCSRPSPTSSTLLAIDARRIVAEVFPDFSLRSWRRWDASGECPAGFMIGNRKVWRLVDLRQWASWGFPDRRTFAAKLATQEESGDV